MIRQVDVLANGANMHAKQFDAAATRPAQHLRMAPAFFDRSLSELLSDANNNSPSSKSPSSGKFARFDKCAVDIKSVQLIRFRVVFTHSWVLSTASCTLRTESKKGEASNLIKK